MVHAFTGQSTSAFWIDDAPVTVGVPDGSNSYYQQDYITLYDGIDSSHSLGAYGVSLGQVGTIRLTGANPSTIAPLFPYGTGGYTVMDFTGLPSSDPTYIRFPSGVYHFEDDGIGGRGLNAGQSIRLQSKGGRLLFYGVNAPTYYHVYKDGSQVTTNATVAVGDNIHAPYQYGSFDLGAIDNVYHDFEVVLTVSGSDFRSIAYEAGTVDTTARFPVRPIAFIGGDSIRASNAAGQTPAGDVTQYWVYKTTKALGWDLYLYALGGSTIDDAYGQGAGEPNLAAALSGFIAGGTSPIMSEEAWGINDTRYPPIDVNGFYTANDGTVAGRSLGAQYPGSGDQAYIDTYKASLQAYINIWFTQFPTAPLLIAKIFKGSANDWLRNYWVTFAQQPAITEYLLSHPGKPVEMENTDAWYDGSDGLHPQISTGKSDEIVPFAVASWASATTPPIQRPANLPFSSTISESWRDASTSLPATFADTGNGTMLYDCILAASSSRNITLPIVTTSFKQPFQSLYIVSTFTQSTGPVTITFGSNTILLTPGIPAVWSSSTGSTCPIPDGTTSFTMTNPNATQALVQVRGLVLVGVT